MLLNEKSGSMKVFNGFLRTKVRKKQRRLEIKQVEGIYLSDNKNSNTSGHNSDHTSILRLPKN